jgi:hypothetical protein
VLQVPFRVRFYDSLMDFVSTEVDAISPLVTLCKSAPPLMDGTVVSAQGLLLCSDLSLFAGLS